MDHLLLPTQAWWDTQRFDQPLWQVEAWRDQKVRHIHLHIAKALGKVVATLDEAAPGTSGAALKVRVRDEVLPDVVKQYWTAYTQLDWSGRSASTAYANAFPWTETLF